MLRPKQGTPGPGAARPTQVAEAGRDSAGFLAAACVALDAEDPFAHAGDAIKCAQRIGKAITASDESCALLLPKTTPAVAAMKVRSQTKVQLGLVNAPSSCVLTGSIQEFVDMVPKTVKLPIRWPVHSSLLDEARVSVQDASELEFLDKHPHCVVLSPEDGEECSTLRKDVLGTLTSQPVVWPSVLDAVQRLTFEDEHGKLHVCVVCPRAAGGLKLSKPSVPLDSSGSIAS